jgi:hypothetical protein
MLHHVVWWKLTEVSEEVLTASITGISEMWANFYRTVWCYIIEYHHHTCCCDNLKSHLHKLTTFKNECVLSLTSISALIFMGRKFITTCFNKL